MSAADLLATIEDNLDHPYSGYVETQGTLQLPVADRFTDVGDLFGEHDPDAGVVAVRRRTGASTSCSPTGETDLIHNVQGTTRVALRAERRRR